MPPPVCKICAETFNTGNKRPLLMPCGRSLCHDCVLQYIKNPNQQCYACLGHHTGVVVGNLQVNFDLLEASIPPPPNTPSAGAEHQSSGMLQIVLQELDGQKYQLVAPATATIKTVKNLIKDQYGFHPPTTRLMSKGIVLKDNCTLASYDIRYGNTLQMITNYEGGRLPLTRL